MVTSIDDIIRVTKHNAAYGLTGRHVRGRGMEGTDGRFSDERPRLRRAWERPVSEPISEQTVIFNKDGTYYVKGEVADDAPIAAPSAAPGG
jgi:hypothetical protein